MKNVDLRVAAVAYLRREIERIKHSPHALEYTAKHVAAEVGGYAGALGQVAADVANDLCASGIQCKYHRNRKPTVFAITIGAD